MSVIEGVPHVSYLQDQVLIQGWRGLVVLSGRDGSTVTYLRLPCQPISPPTLADFSDDGWNDIIITCADRLGNVHTLLISCLHHNYRGPTIETGKKTPPYNNFIGNHKLFMGKKGLVKSFTTLSLSLSLSLYHTAGMRDLLPVVSQDSGTLQS